ncbi:NADP-dependent oxidoreductase domain-containing protein [Pelagophyceae sp. CCMP2097]|nr:NADP-dependent oxidoreductase domain-containing protein [Pelagophyceae sp. CCMP2097]
MAALNVTLGDGVVMPAVGFGTFEIAATNCEAAVARALRAGYRHVDTAEMYGNEAEVGRAIKAHGGPVFITTKIWPGNPDWGQAPKSYEETISACEASLAKLGVPRVDLLLVHTPLGGGPEGRLAQYRGLVECRRRGYAASIGVSNFGVQHLDELEAAGLPRPAANQLELHPFCQKADVLACMRERGIAPIAYSSLAPLSTWRAGYQRYAGSKTGNEAYDGVIDATAQRVGVSPARLLLRYGLQKGWAVLPKSIDDGRLRENMDLDFVIPEGEMADLDACECGAAHAFGDAQMPMDPARAA